jgi:hypothetical protein
MVTQFLYGGDEDYRLMQKKFSIWAMALLDELFPVAGTIVRHPAPSSVKF